ncbi:carboxymuconolactone decarboxylase family protein [Novosphingobium sp. JCM 18896]|uniref:carboxymuconolactone decarboxylase family protein n=1 Tax=Novosphingobium sp. JCM 18896 TaxID=2989731 RepID=UPI0022220D4F|nr:carboxymuconolactone decarboxylase family protein [Novosphingobium sp. JCM 18896]MCW1428653.1 carboxymuconolactone decarboxylase family protein [Novosphingobium sp. JCM 18896]
MSRIETGRIEVDAAARQAHVVGDGPRVTPLPNEQCDAEAFALVNKVRAGAGAPPTTEMPDYMRIMIKNRPLFEPNMILGDALYNGTIPPRERELAILRCGLLCRAPYEWGEHVRIGQRCGLTPEEVNRVLDGSSAEGWNDFDRAVIRGVEELIGDSALSEETWAVLSSQWDERQLIEFPFMIGQYVAIAYVQNTLRVPLADYNVGLSARA